MSWLVREERRQLLGPTPTLVEQTALLDRRGQRAGQLGGHLHVACRRTPRAHARPASRSRTRRPGSRAEPAVRSCTRARRGGARLTSGTAAALTSSTRIGSALATSWASERLVQRHADVPRRHARRRPCRARRAPRTRRARGRAGPRPASRSGPGGPGHRRNGVSTSSSESLETSSRVISLRTVMRSVRCCSRHTGSIAAPSSRPNSGGTARRPRRRADPISTSRPTGRRVGPSAMRRTIAPGRARAPRDDPAARRGRRSVTAPSGDTTGDTTLSRIASSSSERPRAPPATTTIGSPRGGSNSSAPASAPLRRSRRRSARSSPDLHGGRRAQRGEEVGDDVRDLHAAAITMATALYPAGCRCARPP